MIREFGLPELLYLLEGLKWTVVLTILAFAGGGILGAVIALCRTAPSSVLRQATRGYIELFRGTPLLMQLFLSYYGLALFGINLNAWLAAAIAFTLHSSAFLGEIWRGSIEAVPRGQSEASDALSIRYMDRMRFIIIPQAARISLPATVGFLVSLIKSTSLASIIGFVDLTRGASIVSNATFQPFLVFGLVGAMYFVLCWPLSILGSYCERKLAIGQ